MKKTITLGDTLQALKKAELLRNNPALLLGNSVALVTDHSKSVVPDTVFICKGTAFRPAYLAEAERLGACCYVSETIYPESLLPCLHVSDVRAAMGLLAVLYYGHPARELAVVGITGTKGKTTAAYFLREMLISFEAAQNKPAPAFLSSIVTFDGAEEHPSKLTTPEPLEVQRILRTAVENGCRYAVMEVSSQALKYGRVAHCGFAAGVYLNIGEDHVGPGEHPDFEDYFQSKLRLFDQSTVACVNLDGQMSERAMLAAQSAPRILSYSMRLPAADVYAEGIEKTKAGLRFQVTAPRFSMQVNLPMAGLFNVSNALAAIAAAEALGLSRDAMLAGLSAARVPGRMESYDSQDEQIAVLLDYAHNPMSLQALIESARQEFSGRELTVVFGCTGNKGLSRRKPMGEVAGRLADRIFLTEDDPATEEVADICAEIAAGSSKPCAIVLDRRQAIEQAILGCTRPAVVLVAGKGAETIQKRKNGPEVFPGDRAFIAQALALAEVPVVSAP